MSTNTNLSAAIASVPTSIPSVAVEPVSTPKKARRIEPENVVVAKVSHEENEPAPTPKKEKAALKKLAVKPLNDREKFVQAVLRRSGLDALPKLETLFDKDLTVTRKIKDIAIFIGQPEDKLLQSIAAECPHKNIVNITAEVSIKQVTAVMEDVLSSQKMYHVIEVAKVKDAPEGEYAYQCESGRHRLAGLAILYGVDAEIPLRITGRTLFESRDSVVFANKTRSTSAIEKADLIMTQATNGDIEAKPDVAYDKVVRNKTSANDYAFSRSIHQKIYGVKFEFDVSVTSAIGHCMTTATSIKGFLTSALTWSKGLTRIQFDGQIKESLKWLNALVKAMDKIEGFEKRQHMAQQPLKAYGELYKSLATSAGTTGKSPEEFIDSLAAKIVALGDIGRDKKTEVIAKLS
jgi:hypothetical protein